MTTELSVADPGGGAQKAYAPKAQSDGGRHNAASVTWTIFFSKSCIWSFKLKIFVASWWPWGQRMFAPRPYWGLPSPRSPSSASESR